MGSLGMPTMKLKNKNIDTKRGGSFRAIAGEALEERWGKDPDIDREKTKDNIYTGYSSMKDLVEYSDKHVARLEEESGHKIRSDSVRMVAIIFKPSKEYMDTLSRENQIKLLNDTLEKFKELAGSDNVKSSVIHLDEQVPHMHVFFEPMTKDGRLCAKEVVNLKFYNKVNSEIPKHLRSLGWDISDANMYDAEKMTEAEKLRHKEKKRERNLSSTDYKSKAETEKLQNLEKEIMQKKDELVNVSQAPSYEAYSAVIEQNKTLIEELSNKNKLIARLQRELERASKLSEELSRKLASIAHKAGARLTKLFGITETDNKIPEYPSEEIVSEINEMKKTFRNETPRAYRVIPDDQDKSKFRVAVLGNDGKYDTIKGGFESRDAADLFRKNISSATNALSEKIDNSLKHGI